MKDSKKKTIGEHLAEMFLRQSFIDEPNKKAVLWDCFCHDMRWFFGFIIFVVVSIITVYLGR